MSFTKRHSSSAKVIDDPKSAKSLINIGETNEASHVEVNLKIAEYLGSVEAYLVSEAHKSFPPQTVDNWLKQIENPAMRPVPKSPRLNPDSPQGCPEARDGFA